MARDQKQQKLRTFEDVLHRMRWDESFDMATMTIGYEDRLVGAMEMPLRAFVPISEGGDLPMHRVWYVRRGDEVLWDRRRRLDLIFRSGETAAILARGGSSPDTETQVRINEGKANVEEAERLRLHMLHVKEHEQQRRIAALARFAETTSARPSTQADASLLSKARAELILKLFRACDADEDGHLKQEEMLNFAMCTGFEGGSQAWAEEYRLVCAVSGVDLDIGVGIDVFKQLVNDGSEEGCYCSDVELEEMFAGLRSVPQEAAAGTCQVREAVADDRGDEQAMCVCELRSGEAAESRHDELTSSILIRAA